MRRLTTQDEKTGADPGAFLGFLTRDMVAHSDRPGTLPERLREEIERLTHGVPVAHGEPLDGAVEL